MEWGEGARREISIHKVHSSFARFYFKGHTFPKAEDRNLSVCVCACMHVFMCACICYGLDCIPPKFVC